MQQKINFQTKKCINFAASVIKMNKTKLKRKKRVLAIFLLCSLSLLYPTVSLSQNLSFTKAEASIHYGYVAPHHDAMQHLFKGHSPTYEFTVSWKTKGSQSWHHLYNYPYLGIGFAYTDMSYPEVLGKAYSVIPSATFPLINYRTYSLNLKTALGLAYLTKKYDRLENYRNTAIGSNLNVAVNFVLENGFLIGETFSVSAGIGVLHFSNGRTRTPNLGVNIPSLKLGMSYNNPKAKAVKEPAYTEPKERSSEIIVIASGGLAAEYPPGSNNNFRADISSLLNYPISKKHRLGIGYDIFYYYNQENLLSHIDETYVKELFNHGLFISFQFDFSRLAFVIQNGIYLYDKYNYQQSLLYHRVGFRYRIYKNIILNLSMKTHFSRAQFIETGIGYRFN